jgi:hypothetical protein
MATLSPHSILLNNKTTQLDYGLVVASNTSTSSLINHNFLEEDERFDAYLAYRPPHHHALKAHVLRIRIRKFWPDPNPDPAKEFGCGYRFRYRHCIFK